MHEPTGVADVKIDEYDEAINLLARFAAANLPNGHTLHLTFSKTEASMRVEGPDGDEIEVDDPPCGFVDHCDMAIEAANEQQ